MAVTWLVLEDDSAGADTITPLLAALDTATAAKYGGTVNQTTRSLAGSRLIVKANITLAERTGDLAAVARDQRGVGIFKDEFVDQADKELKIFDMLGESGRDIRYLRPETPGGHGQGDGLTYGDAWNGDEDTTTIGASWPTGTTIWRCGFHCAIQKPTGGFAHTLDPTFQDATGAPTRFRMDDRLDPGFLHLGAIDTRGTNNAFTQPDAANFPRVWKATWSVATPNSAHTLTPIDPTASTTDIYTNNIFTDVSSQSEVESTSMSRWVNGSDLWVHMPDDSDPNDRIAGGSPMGYSPAHSYMQASPATPYEGLEFINCQMMWGHGSAAMTKNSGETLEEIYPNAKFLGGRYLYGASWKPQSDGTSGMEWGRSTDGTIPWDTSDRPDPSTDTYIGLAVSRHGSDQATWNEMDHFIEIDSADEGIYWFAGIGGTTVNDNGTIDGALIRNIGKGHSILVTKLGSSTFSGGDMHALATQGGAGWDIGFVYIQNAGSAVNWYSQTDATGAQDMTNNAIHDFVIRDSNGQFTASTAGMNGIFFNGDGQAYLRTNGQGVYTGNTIQRGVIYNIIGDPSGTAFGSPAIIADGGAINLFLTDELYIDNVSLIACTHGLAGQRNADMALGESGGTAATNPASGARADPLVRMHNSYYDQIIERNVYMRTTHWNDTPQTIVSITKANPCVVEITGHGFPDIAQANVYIEPEVYFNCPTGMTELDGNTYKAVWIDANKFSLKTLAGAAVDSTGFGTFTSGTCERACIGYLDLQSNTVILPSGKTSASDIYRLSNSQDYTLAELQALSRNPLPAANSNVYESGTSIAA